MNFQLQLELVTKGMDAFNKAIAAEKAAGDAAKVANAATVASSQKAEAALHAEANAAKAAEAATKGLAAATKASGVAASEQSSRMARAAQVSAQALQHMKAGASAAGSAISSAFGKSLSAMHSVGGAALRAGRGVGGEFAKGVGEALRSELSSRVQGALQSAWGRATGFQFMTGQGALRANAASAVSGVNGLVGTAVNQALANVRSATDAEERLRADYGSEGARRALASADAAMVNVPFGRDDVRAALPDMMAAGIDPSSDRFRMIADAAAANGQTMAAAAAAYRAAKGGDFSGLPALGLNVANGADGKAALAYRANGQDVRAALDADNAGDTQSKVDQALKSRYADAAARRGASIDGLITKASNSWDTFVGKVMNAGPLQYFREEMQGVLKMFDDAVKSGSLDKFATELGTGIKEGMIEAKHWIKETWLSIQEFGLRLQPALDAVGGLGGAFKMLAGVAIASWVASLITPFLALGVTLGMVSISSLAITGALLAIAAAAYLVYANWDKIGPALSNAWAAVKATAVAAWEAIKTKASDAWQGVTGAAERAWAAVKTSVSDAWTWVSTAIGERLDAATGRIRDWGGAALTAMQEAFGKVKGWFDTAVGGLSAVWDKVANAGRGALAYVGLGKDATPEEKNAAAAQRAIADAGRAEEAIKLLTDLQALLPQVAAAVSAFDLAAPINVAIGAARGALAGFSFHAEGVAMMATLAAGIEAGAAKAVAAVHAVTQQMRDYLPHSPAKVGPLSDLDQVKFSETLALAIRPDPAVSAVRAVAAGMAEAMSPRIGVLAAAGVDGRSLSAPGGGAGNASVVFSPNVVIPEGRERDGQFIMGVLRGFAHELADIVNQQNRNKERLSYGGA